MRDSPTSGECWDKIAIAAAPHAPELANMQYMGRSGGPIRAIDLTTER